MRIPVFAAFFVAACSSSEPSSTPTPSPDAGVDAELTGTKCGPPPYVKWSGTVTFKDGSGDKPAAGAKMTAESCPGESLTVGADGKFELLLTKGAKSFARIEKEGSLKNIVGEWAPDADQANIGIVLLPNIFAALIPDWDPSTEPAVVISAGPAAGATGACADKSGITFTVTGQPDAKISYFDEGSIPTAIDGATATGKSGLVAISNATGSSIEIVGTKSGCTVSTKTRLQSGKVAIAPQFLTTMIAEVRN